MFVLFLDEIPGKKSLDITIDRESILGKRPRELSPIKTISPLISIQPTDLEEPLGKRACLIDERLASPQAQPPQPPPPPPPPPPLPLEEDLSDISDDDADEILNREDSVSLLYHSPYFRIHIGNRSSIKFN